MKKLTKILCLFTLLLISKNTSAEIVQIEFTKFDTYSAEIVYIKSGDTIEWLPNNGEHNVEFLSGPQMVSLPNKSKINMFHSVIFDKLGIYLYGCTPHLNMGMLGLIIVDNNFENIADIRKIDLSPVASSVLNRLLKKVSLHSTKTSFFQ